MGVYKLSTAGGLKTPRTNYSSFLAGNPAVQFGAYESIATTTLGSSQSSITFSSIPATFKHLQLRVIGRTDRSGSAFDAFLIKANNDGTSGKYFYHYIVGDGATIGAGIETAYNGAVTYRIGGATAPANTFGVVITDILDYTSTSKYKTFRSLGGADYNGSSPQGEVYFGSNLWTDTTDITSLVIVPRTGTNFVQYSQFALYGIKGA
jgi:hypothetical protein